MLDAANVPTEALEAFDDMMVEATMKVEKCAPLADAIWADVLKELDGRGRVRLHSGSYDDVGNALIERLR
jgi:hypothetical protein